MHKNPYHIRFSKVYYCFLLPQRVLASWRACLFRGSRNKDETCHMSLRRCCLSGESLQQTLTHWRTAQIHGKQETIFNLMGEATLAQTQNWCTYLDFGQSVHFLPVPHREDVVIGVINDTKSVSSVLACKTSTSHSSRDQKVATTRAWNGLRGFPYRLWESEADHPSVKETCAQNMEGVEADGVPYSNVRSQMLAGKKWHRQRWMMDAISDDEWLKHSVHFWIY